MSDTDILLALLAISAGLAAFIALLGFIEGLDR